MGISFAEDMITTKARLFDPPNVYYGNSAAGRYGSVKNGGWNLNGQIVTTSIQHETTYAMLQITTGGQNQAMGDSWAQASQSFSKAFKSMNVGTWKYHEGAYSDHIAPLQNVDGHPSSKDDNSNEDTLRSKFKAMKDKEVDLVFVLLPRRSLNTYAMVKRVSDNLVGIHTICCVLKKDRTGQLCLNSHSSYHLNLMLKATLKFGGASQWLGPDWGRSGVLSQPTMFVGIDVTHPGAGAQKDAPSIAAVVATTEHTTYAQWKTSLRTQRGDMIAMETVLNLRAMLMECLNAWRDNPANNDTLPQHIIIYRDGGSRGFFKRILDDEWPQISSALAHDSMYGLDPADQPRVALICAIKRNSTRFFATEEAKSIDLGSKGNLRGGLYVDDTVTLNNPSTPDFFLQSHDSLRSTAKPIHYAILKNELGVSKEQLALLTHDCCHLFGRATRTVSCHPAIYYADLACDRARVHMRRAFVPYRPGMDYVDGEWGVFKQAHKDLKDTMYFV